MDSLALLCNLHADGPESLRRLRRAGVADLRGLFALGVEGIEPLLGRGRPAAQRFLKEARLLEQRQLLSDAEDASAAVQRPGAPAQPPPRERWPSVGNPPGQPGWSASGAPLTGAPAHEFTAGGAPLDNNLPYNPGPRSAEERSRPAAGSGARPTHGADWDAGNDERSTLAGTGDQSGLDEGLGDYVLSPTPPGREPGGDGAPVEPRHSVLSALLAAWSRGHGPEDADAGRPPQGRAPSASGAPTSRPPEAFARPLPAGPALAAPTPAAPTPAAPTPASPMGTVPGEPSTAPLGGREPASGDAWLGRSVAQTGAPEGPLGRGWPAPSAAADPATEGIARFPRGSPWAPGGGAAATPAAALASGPRAPSEPQTIDLDAFLSARAEPAMGPREPSGAVLQTPRGAPLAWLINEQIDPAALGALERQGLSTLEQVLAGDPRDLSRQAGLSYTLVLRLQYLARRTLNERGV